MIHTTGTFAISAASILFVVTWLIGQFSAIVTTGFSVFN